MSDGTTWVDISPDFDPIDYAQAFADDDVLEAVSGADSSEEQLICLYENGYLSKRNGRIKYLVPDDLDEENYAMTVRKPDEPASAKKPSRMSGLRDKASETYGKMKGAAGERVDRMRTAGAEAVKHGPAEFSRARKYMAGVGSTMSGKEKLAVGGGAAALGVGGLMAARSLYKKAKARREAKQESFDEDDIAFLVQEAELLGFTINTFDELDEAINLGGEVEDLLLDADEEGLTEDYSVEDILSAALGLDETYDADSADTLNRLGVPRKYVPGTALAKRAETGLTVHKKGMSKGAKVALGAAGAAGLTVAGLAAYKLYKKMKARKAAKKNESLTSEDLQDIITDSVEFGFEFESYDNLVEALIVGELVANGFSYYLDDDTLAEGVSDDVEEEVMEALLYDLDEEDKSRVGKVREFLSKKYTKGKQAYSGSKTGKMLAGLSGKEKAGAGLALGLTTAGLMYTKHQINKLNKKDKKNESIFGESVKKTAQASALGAGVGGLTASGLLYRQGRKAGLSKKEAAKRAAKYGAAAGAVTATTSALGHVGGKKLGKALQGTKVGEKIRKMANESIEFNGYRSSAQGGVYENLGPIPFGTGNQLYNRIKNDLLS